MGLVCLYVVLNNTYKQTKPRHISEVTGFSSAVTRSSSGDEIANVNCFTTTSYVHCTTKYNRLAHKFWHGHRPHRVYYKPEAKHHNNKKPSQR